MDGVDPLMHALLCLTLYTCYSVQLTICKHGQCATQAHIHPNNCKQLSLLILNSFGLMERKCIIIMYLQCHEAQNNSFIVKNVHIS